MKIFNNLNYCNFTVYGAYLPDNKDITLAPLDDIIVFKNCKIINLELVSSYFDRYRINSVIILNCHIAHLSINLPINSLYVYDSEIHNLISNYGILYTLLKNLISHVVVFKNNYKYQHQRIKKIKIKNSIIMNTNELKNLKKFNKKLFYV